MTKVERKYLDRVASLGCAICRRLGYGETPPQIHHQRTGVGKSLRASHYNVIPLCPEHHLGNTGIHGMGLRAFEREYQITEIELVAETQSSLGYAKENPAQ